MARRVFYVSLVFLGLLWACGIGTLSARADSQTHASPQLEFRDDFEDGDLEGWVAESPADWFVGCAGVAGTAFVLMPFDQGGLRANLWVAGVQWTDLQLEVNLRGLCGVDKGIRFRDDYLLAIRSSPYNDVVLDRPGITVASAPLANELGEWHHVAILAEGARIRVSVDGVQVIDVVDPEPVLAGRVGLHGHTGAVGACQVQWDDFVVSGSGATKAGPCSWGSLKSLFR